MASPANPQVKLLHRMVDIYSPTGEESEIAHLLVEEMHSLGLQARTDEVGNAVGESSGEHPAFLLCGHMDTVPGELPVGIRNNKLYGRGAVDAKSALATIVSAAGVLVQKDFPAKLIVVGAVEEDGKSRGIKNVIAKGTKAEYGVFGEPSGIDQITIAYKGSLNLNIQCHTKTGHSSAPWLYRNAIDESIDLWSRLRNVHFPEERTDSKFHSLTSTITSMRGGSPFSTVPSYCELNANIRLPPAIPSKRFLDEASVIADQFRSERGDVRVEIQPDDFCEAYEADVNSNLVRGISWGVRDVRKTQAVLLRKTGTGDMNLAGASLGVPMVTYGPGDSKLDHTDDECVDLDEYMDSIVILQKGLVRTLELHNRLEKRRI